MRKVTYKEALEISTETMKRAERERQACAEAEAALEATPKEIWVIMALNQALLDVWQKDKASKKTNYTKPGFYFDEQEAVEAVLANANDLCEAGMNDYAVVYPILEGLDMYCEDRERMRWFKYVADEDKYQEIDKQDTGYILLDF